MNAIVSILYELVTLIKCCSLNMCWNVIFRYFPRPAKCYPNHGYLTVDFCHLVAFAPTYSSSKSTSSWFWLGELILVYMYLPIFVLISIMSPSKHQVIYYLSITVNSRLYSVKLPEYNLQCKGREFRQLVPNRSFYFYIIWCFLKSNHRCSILIDTFDQLCISFIYYIVCEREG